ADREPETGAAVFARCAAVGLLELLKYPAQCFRRNADPRIDDRQLQYLVALAGADGNVPGMGELGRVAEQIEHDLLDFILVRGNQGQVGGQCLRQGHARAYQRLDGGSADVDQRRGAEAGQLYLQTPCLDLGDVEDRVDQA